LNHRSSGQTPPARMVQVIRDPHRNAPVSWDRLLGHADIVDRIRRAHARGRLGHAYLLVGPEGVGKRTFARELAKAILCEAGRPFDACNVCAACHLVDAGTHPDLIIVTKPEDRLEFPISAMRDFIGKFGLKPSRGPRKVAIVEDAEVFNEESANAFLKTLEEPPPGSLLLLRALHLESQLSTIRSRCQPLVFGPLSTENVRAILIRLGTLPTERIDSIAALSQGSVRRALALADDEIMAFRESLMRLLNGSRIDAAALVDLITVFIDTAGKESAAKRARATLAVDLLVDVLRSALRIATNAAPLEADDSRMNLLAARVGPEPILKALDACVSADRHIDQRVNIPVAMDALIDRIAI
jgi:DNA polymerase III subunit delta'